MNIHDINKALVNTIQVDEQQFKREVAERNRFRLLLDECLFALNNLPRQRIADGDGGDTYKLASKIEAEFKATDTKAVIAAKQQTKRDDDRPQGLFN